MYEIKEFSNGLKLVVAHMPHMQSVSAGIWVKAGGRYEDERVFGISHFLEHMSFKGTPKRTAKQISESIEGVGGSINAFTGEEMTCYYASVTRSDLEVALDVLSDLFINAALEQSEINKERGVILDEMRMYVDMPGQHVGEMLSEIMFDQHPLGRMLVGNEKTIKRIQKTDFIKYKERGYSSKNTLVAIAGDLRLKSISSVVEKVMQTMPNRKVHSFEPFKDHQKKSQIKIEDKKTQQTHFALGFKESNRLDPDRFGVKLLSIILGENMSSRLFQEIREKRGLTYDIGSSVEKFHDIGSLVVSAGVDNNRFEEALQASIVELRKISDTLVSKKELDMAKRYVKGQLAMALEKTSSSMMFIGEQMLCTGEIIDQKNIFKAFDQVTCEDVQRLAKKSFKPHKANLAIIGSKIKKNNVEKILRNWDK